MSNHVHLLIRTSEISLSEFARKTLTGYAKYFNRRYKRRGYVYQNRYKSILCQEDVYLLELVRYIHLNPVRAGMVESLAELDRYPWTGHSAMVGKCARQFQTTDEILMRFGADRKTAVAAYRRFIQDGWAMGKRPDLVGSAIKRNGSGWGDGSNPDHGKITWRGEESLLGDDDFIREILNRAKEAMIQKERQIKAGWCVERLAGRVCALLSVEKEELRRKGRQNGVSFAKGLLAYWGYQVIGLSGSEIARYLEISRPALIRSIRLGERVAKDKGLKLIS